VSEVFAFEKPEFESVAAVYTDRDLQDDFVAAVRGNPDEWWRVPENLARWLYQDWWRRSEIGERIGDIAVVTSERIDGGVFVKYLGEWDELRREYQNYKRAEKLNEPYSFTRTVSVGEEAESGIWWENKPKPEDKHIGLAVQRKRWWQW
jgi:hypothetical protein